MNRTTDSFAAHLLAPAGDIELVVQRGGVLPLVPAPHAVLCPEVTYDGTAVENRTDERTTAQDADAVKSTQPSGRSLKRGGPWVDKKTLWWGCVEEPQRPPSAAWFAHGGPASDPAVAERLATPVTPETQTRFGPLGAMQLRKELRPRTKLETSRT